MFSPIAQLYQSLLMSSVFRHTTLLGAYFTSLVMIVLGLALLNLLVVVYLRKLKYLKQSDLKK